MHAMGAFFFVPHPRNGQTHHFRHRFLVSSHNERAGAGMQSFTTVLCKQMKCLTCLVPFAGSLISLTIFFASLFFACGINKKKI